MRTRLIITIALSFFSAAVLASTPIVVSGFGTLISNDGVHWLNGADQKQFFYAMTRNANGQLLGLRGNAYSRPITESITSSADGVNWQTIYKKSFDADSRLFYLNDSYMLLDKFKGDLYKSTDGINWQFICDKNCYLYDSWPVFNDMAYGNHQYIGVGGFVDISDEEYLSVGAIIGSDDNAYHHWKIIKSQIPQLNAVVFGNNRFVAAGYDIKNKKDVFAIAYLSHDGKDWQRYTIDSKSNVSGVFGIAFGNNVFLAAGYKGRDTEHLEGMIYSSLDGENWQPLSLPQNIKWIKTIRYVNQHFVALAENAIITSPDGEHWTVDIDDKFQAFGSIS